MKKTLLVLTWLLLAPSGCAAVLNVGLNPYVIHVTQRGDNDCGIAVLAMASGRSYEEVSRIAAPFIAKQHGLLPTDFVKVGKTLGVNLLPAVAVYNLATDEGVLVVLPRGADFENRWHAVYLFHGDVYDPLQLGPAAAVLMQDRWERVFFLRRIR